jgi:hypothetical protein
MYGYEKASVIEASPSIIVILLNCIRIKNAIEHKIKVINKDFFMLILSEAKGLFFVLSTFLSKSLSIMSLTMHPALLISIEPRKKSNKKNKFFFKS